MKIDVQSAYVVESKVITSANNRYSELSVAVCWLRRYCFAARSPSVRRSFVQLPFAAMRVCGAAE